jgi:carbon monoxide dehydrogenase subunit G
MAIKFSGEFEVKKKPEEVYDFLTDPNRFARLLPEFQSLSVQDATHFAVRVNVGISYIKGSADVKMELAEGDRPRRAQYKGQGAVGGGNVTMVAGFDLSPIADGTAPAAADGTAPAAAAGTAPAAALGNAPAAADGTPLGTADGTPPVTALGTKVNWQGEAQIFGRLASVAGGLLEPLGRKQIQKLIDGLQAALG